MRRTYSAKMWTLILVIILLVFVIWTWAIQPGSDFPPGPLRFPIINTFWAMLPKSKYRHITVDILRKYGKDGMCSLKFGTRDMVVLGTPDLVHEAFLTKAHQTSSRPKAFASAIFDGVGVKVMDDPVAFEKWQRGGVIGSVGELWKQNRKLAFTKLLSKHRIHLMEGKILHEMDLFRQYAANIAQEGTPFDPVVEFPKLAMNVITEIAFSQRFNTWGNAAAATGHSTGSTMDPERLAESVRFIFHFFRPSNPESSFRFLSKFPWSKVPSFEEKCGEIRTFLHNILKEREASMDPHLEDSEMDFIDVMLRARAAKEEEYAEDDRSMVTTMLDFLLAGTDTTSMSAASLVRHLANDADLQRRLQEEIDSVVGSDRPVALNDLEKLELLDACTLEQMRLWPVAPLTLIHVASEDLTLRGYKIPKGTFMTGVMSNFMIDEKEFPEPNVFKPERWIKNPDLQKSKYFAPFGVGPRICAGRYLAESESRLLVASFLQRFNFTPYDNRPIPYEEANMLTSSPVPFKLKLEIRN